MGLDRDSQGSFSWSSAASARGLRPWLVLATLSALLLASSWPALTGTWVFDDRLMLHPALASLKELLPAFARTSNDYFGADAQSGHIVGVATYRPIPMVSFILVNGTLGVDPLPHHVLSLAAHLLVVLMLVRLSTREGRCAPLAVAGIAAFALHPALTEAYLWINGRSDALAGLWLLLFGLPLLSPRAEGPLPMRRALPLVLFALLGLLSKETFLIGAAALLLAAILPERAPAEGRAVLLSGFAQRVRELRPALIALPVAALIGLAGRAAAVQAVTFRGGLAETSIPVLLTRVPRVLALGTEALLAPLPRTMRLIAWEISTMSFSRILLPLALLICLLVFLLLRGRYRAVALLLGALATLAPAALLADSFWLGLDRYLYLPACLIALALCPALASGRHQARRRAWLALGLLLTALPISHHLSARFYRSHTEFCLAMLDDRPDDPSAYVMAARDALDQGATEVAARILTRMPDVPLPPPLAHAASALLLSLRMSARAARITEETALRHPESPDMRFDLLSLRLGQGRFEEAAGLAAGLLQDPVRREATRRVLLLWLGTGRVPPDHARLMQKMVGT